MAAAIPKKKGGEGRRPQGLRNIEKGKAGNWIRGVPLAIFNTGICIHILDLDP